MQFLINGNNPDQLIGFIVFALVFVAILVALLFLELTALSSKGDGEFAKRMLIFGAYFLSIPIAIHLLKFIIETYIFKK